MGRLIGTTTTYSFLPASPFTNAYTYDAASNRTGFTAPDGSTNAYTYDTLNRLANLNNSWAGQFGFAYDALSRRTQMTRPNNVTTNYSYDKLSRLLSVLHQNGASTIDGAGYTLDAAGNRTAKTDQLANVTSNYGYDPIYELTQVTQAANTTESYSYDAVGNRTASLGMGTYTTNASNEMTAVNGALYGYDNNGNTVTRTDSNGTTQYAWDFENRLTTLTLPNSGGTVAFRYDPFGRRIYKQSPSATSIFVYDGDNMIETLNAAGGTVARYTQGRNIDEPLAIQRGSTTDYYEADGLGSITSLTAPNGSVGQNYRYDSYGNVTTSGGAVANLFQYAAREFDTETSLYYYRARYYDPSLGRFISEDPIRFHGGLNYYRYVFNHIVNYRDPSGLQCNFYQPFDGHYGQPVPPPRLMLSWGISLPVYTFMPLSSGGFYYYGNWGGPGWTGGSLDAYENMTPEQRSKLAPPIDEQDVCYMHHDICYANARCNNASCKKAETEAEQTCDMELYDCLQGLNNPNMHSRAAEPAFSVGELIPWWLHIF
jgi:RHS repeat-associated protein